MTPSSLLSFAKAQGSSVLTFIRAGQRRQLVSSVLAELEKELRTAAMSKRKPKLNTNKDNASEKLKIAAIMLLKPGQEWPL
jgi:hypothetical protein